MAADDDLGEVFEVSVFSDSSRTQQIGNSQAFDIREGNAVLKPDPNQIEIKLIQQIERATNIAEALVPTVKIYIPTRTSGMQVLVNSIEKALIGNSLWIMVEA